MNHPIAGVPPVRRRLAPPALALALLLCPLAYGQTATINVSTTSPQTLKRKLTSFNNGDYRTAYDISVTDYVNQLDGLKLGWFRWFSGTVTNAFNWERGAFDDEKRAQLIHRNHYLQYVEFGRRMGLKGNTHLKDTYDVISALGLKLLITVNGMTSSVDEIDALAKFCFDHGIKVDAWQLSNEPELWSGAGDLTFYKNAADYLKKMKPFNDAIKARFTDARTYVFYSTRPFTTDGDAWNTEMKAYQRANGRYWDGICFHSYDGGDEDDTFSKKQLSANASLRDFDAKFDEYETKSWTGAPFITTELNTRIQTASEFWFTLYNGIYLAEATLRLSKRDNFEMIGRSRTTPGLIAPTYDFEDLLEDKWEKGASVNVNSLPHSLYDSAAAHATSIVDQAINRAATRLTTTVSNSLQVSYKDAGGQTMNALFAQGYRGKNGQFYVCITNKGATAQSIDLKVDNATVNQSIAKTILASSDPAANNTPANHSVITPTTGSVSSGTGISIPAYSVCRFEWTVAVSAPTLDAPRVYERIVGNGSLTLKWQPVDEAAGYKVSCWISGTPTPVDVGNVLTHTVTGLTNQTYNFQVTPYYINGLSQKISGPASPSDSITISAPGAPDLVAYPLVENQIALSWTSKVRASEYEVTWSAGGGGSNVVQVGPVTSYILSNCVSGTTYSFTVKAKNGAGTSAASTAAVVQYPTGNRNVPWAGVNLRIGANNNGITLKWELPMSLSQRWSFESPQGATGWTTNATNAFQLVAHPDNSVQLGGTAKRDTTVYKALAASSLSRAWIGDINATDYLAQARVEVPSWTSSGKVWVFARYQNANTWYRFGYDYSDQKYHLQKKTGAGNPVELVAASAAAPPTVARLGIRVDGNVVSGYLDYDVLLTATDTSIASGQFALAADHVDVLFDRVDWYDTHMATGTFEVWRSSTAPTSGFSLRGTTSAGAKSYSDSANVGTTYYYKVRGLKNGRESRDFSNVRTVVAQ